MATPQPTRIGKYEITSVLGKGAMGVVYRATDPTLGRHVAIKTMSSDFLHDDELRHRFLREARSAGRLQHQNIVTVHELLETDDTTFIVMELLEGASLHALIRKGNPLDLSEKLSILIQVAGGLQHAHEHGIVHRDLKPSNIFILRSGVAKIVDFGVAKFGESELTRAGTVFGTLEYMAPEQVQGKPVDTRADIFSLGVVAYELLSGRNPFRAETLAASVFKVLSDNPDRLVNQVHGLPQSIETTVFRAISKRSEHRFASAAELGTALLTAAHEAGIEPRPPRLSHDVVDSASREAVNTHSEPPQLSQWSNVAAAAGQLDRMFRAGIDCFAREDYEGCVLKMSEVLDAVPVHSMALHYLAQSEEKLRQQRLDPEQYQEASALLAALRRAHREEDPGRVIERANRFLATDPESMEARWYRRNAETRLTSSPHRRSGSVVSASSSYLSPPAGYQETQGYRPTLVLPTPMASSDRSRAVGIWALCGAAFLFVALIALVWGFGGDRRDSTPSRKADTSRPSPVRPSMFEDEEAVILHVPSRPSPEVTPSVNSVHPKRLVAGATNTVRLFGSNFAPNSRVLPASVAGDVELLSTSVVSDKLIEITLRPTPELLNREVYLLVVNPNGGRSAKHTLHVVASDNRATSTAPR